MESFSVAKLDTTIGIIRTHGEWCPLTGEIFFIELAIIKDSAREDVSFWLTEQEFEENIVLIVEALRKHLIIEKEGI